MRSPERSDSCDRSNRSDSGARRRWRRLASLAWLVPVLDASAWPPPKIPREQYPADMPGEIRRHLDVLYDFAPDHSRCVPALKAIAAMGPAAACAAPFIASALDRRSCISNEEAAETLIRIGKAAVEPTIVAFGVADPHGRARALHVLRALRDPRAVPAIAAAIADDIRSREDVPTLLELGGEQYLTDCLKDESAAVRRMAVRVLPALGTDRAARALVGAIADTDEKVRQFALQGLGEMRVHRGDEIRVALTDSMFEALKSSDAATRRFAVRLISKSVGDPARKVAALAPLVGDPDDEVQLEVVNALGWIKGADVVDALRRHIEHPSDLARAAVATALGRTGQPEAMPLVDALLRDKAGLVRENAIQSLAGLHGPAAAARIGVILNRDSDPMVIRRALQILTGWRSQEQLGDLARFLASGDESVRIAALDAAAALGARGQDTLLAGLGDANAKVREHAFGKLSGSFRPEAESVRRLLTMANHPDPATRGYVFGLLATRGCSVPDLGPVRKALDDSHWEVTANAIRILDRRGDTGRIDRIRQLAMHGHDQVAEAALEAMQRVGDAVAVASGLRHYHPRVRAKAQQLLSRMDRAKVAEATAGRAGEGTVLPPTAGTAKGTAVLPPARVTPPDTPESLAASLRWRHANPRDPVREKLVAFGDAAVGPLGALLTETRPELRAAAAEILGQIRGPAVLAPLVRALSDDAPLVRESAVSALGRLGDAGAATALVSAAASPDWHLRSDAVRGLAGIGKGKSPAALLAPMRDPHWYVRCCAAEALSGSDSDAAVPALISLLDDEHWCVRRAARAGLGAVCGLDLGPDAARWRAWRQRKDSP